MKCFVIMPISDPDDYVSGHFSRVYEYIIKPACNIAGFDAIRANDIMTTNYIAVNIIKNILECEMAICDLSSRNPNVLYELGIRQAFNKPVTLIKDSKTDRVFDISGFRDIEYNETLRIDSVEKTIQDLSEVIKNTYNNTHSEINSLIGLLEIEPAKLSEKKTISIDTELILDSISALNNRIDSFESKSYSAIQFSQFGNDDFKLGEFLNYKDCHSVKVGDKLYHTRLGVGKVTKIDKIYSSYVIYFMTENGRNMIRTTINEKSDSIYRKLLN